MTYISYCLCCQNSMSLQLISLGNFFSEFMDLCYKEFMLLYIDYAVEELHTFISQTKNLRF